MRILKVVLGMLFGIGRKKPTTKLGHAMRRGEYSIVVVCVLYLGLLFFPQGLFAGSVDQGVIRLYHQEGIETRYVERVLERAEALLQKSEVYDDQRRWDVYVCDSYTMFGVMSPRSRKALGVAHPFVGNSFIAMADFEKDKSYRMAGDVRHERVLSQVIAHEATHLMLSRHLGIPRYILLAGWKDEGYCEVVSRGFSNDLATEITALTMADKKPVTYAYRRNRLLVDYLITIKKMSFMEVAKADLDMKDVEAEMVKWATPELE